MVEPKEMQRDKMENQPSYSYSMEIVTILHV